MDPTSRVLSDPGSSAITDCNRPPNGDPHPGSGDPVVVAEAADDSRSKGTLLDPVSFMIAANFVTRLVLSPGNIWDDDGILTLFNVS